MFSVDVAINGICCAPFILDSGSSDVSVSPRLFKAMVDGGHVTKDMLIDVTTYQTANGMTPGVRFHMPPLTLGALTIYNVVGSVSPDSDLLLLGQSFLGHFRSWSIDNQTDELVLR